MELMELYSTLETSFGQEFKLVNKGLYVIEPTVQIEILTNQLFSC